MIQKLFYSIKEVSDMLGVEKSALRYWEKEFNIHPKRLKKGGDRRYSQENIAELKNIKYLLKDKGLTIDGARTELKRNKKIIIDRVQLLDMLNELKSDLMQMKELVSKR